MDHCECYSRRLYQSVSRKGKHFPLLAKRVCKEKVLPVSLVPETHVVLV